MKKSSSTFLFLLLCLVTLVMGTRYVYVLNNKLKEENTAYLEAIVDTTANVIDRELLSSLDSLGAMADMIGQYEDKSNEEKAAMVANTSLAPRYVRFGVADTSGWTVLSNGAEFDFSFREFMKSSLNGEYAISEVLIDVFTNEEINVFSTPIYNSDRVLTGVLFGTVDTDKIRTMLNSSSSKMLESKAYIIDSKGNLVVSFETPLSELGPKNMLELEFVKQSDYEVLEYNLRNAGTGVFEYLNDGVATTAAYTPLSYNDWYVVIEADSYTINDGYNVIMSETSVMLLAIVVVYAIFILVFIHQQKKTQTKLENLAFIDPVTHTYNWNHMLSQVKSLLKNCVDVTKYYVVSLDIDKFKLLNDVYGYNQGNKVICNVAQTIKEILGEDECFARYVADNFTIFMRGDTRDSISARLDGLIETIEDENRFYNFNVSCGVYQVSDSKTNFSSMNDRANIAKKGVKNTIDNKVAFYEDVMRKTIMEEKEIENDMYFALKNREFLVYFQPKYDSLNNKPIGAEALVRWNHHDKGLISPGAFIPVFEKNRFIMQLDRYVLEETCAVLAKWRKEGRELLTISVNLSRFHLANPNLGNELMEILDKYGIEQKYIELELTETVFLEENGEFINALRVLKSMGFMLAIDDFGSGYSSLKLLKEIPADVLKIDKAFIDQIQDNGKEKIVVEHVANLAKALKMQVVCEGVEREEQVNILKQLGCFYIQGYYYAKPMPVDEFVKNVFKKN